MPTTPQPAQGSLPAASPITSASAAGSTSSAPLSSATSPTAAASTQDHSADTLASAASSSPITVDARTALIAVDLQQGILGWVPEETRTQLVSTTATLAAAFHEAGLPVVWVHATGLPIGRVAHPIPETFPLPEDFTQLHPDLPVHGEDIHIFKPRTMGAFSRTSLGEDLHKAAVTHVIVTGVATGAGVEGAARGAFDWGFNVTVVTDGVFDGNAQRHQSSLSHVFPSIATLATSGEVLAALNHRGTITIRELQPSDAEWAAELYAANQRARIPESARANRGFVQGQGSPESIIARISKPGSWVAEVDGTRAGFALSSYIDAFRHGAPGQTAAVAMEKLPGKQLFLYGPAAVDDRFRRRGVLSALVDKVLAETAGRFDAAIAFVETSNVVSMKVHEHLGFTRVGTFTVDSRDYIVYQHPTAQGS